jgi:hypothetical protein
MKIRLPYYDNCRGCGPVVTLPFRPFCIRRPTAEEIDESHRDNDPRDDDLRYGT